MSIWPDVDRAVLRAWRGEQVRTLMTDLDLDHVVLGSVDAIRYATDYRTYLAAEVYDWFAAVVERSGQAVLFVPYLDETLAWSDPETPTVTALHPTPSWTPVVGHAGWWGTALAAALPGARRVGYESLYPEVLQALGEALPGVELVPIGRALHDLRIVKHPLEVALLEAASIVNATAAQAGLAAAEPGMRDDDVLAVIAAHQRRAGVEFLSHGLCNHRRGKGSWFSEGSVLAEGDAFFFDVGCYGHGGYASDIARVGFVGEPPAEVAKAYDVLVRSLEVACEASRPGVRASVVHETVNAFLAGQGYPITPYSMGHGVGLRLCELPTIHRADRMERDQVLAEGAVIALEPETGVEVNGEFVLMKIEDNYVVEADGVRLLSAPSTP